VDDLSSIRLLVRVGFPTITHTFRVGALHAPAMHDVE
jgi:hypothetical protein